MTEQDLSQYLNKEVELEYMNNSAPVLGVILRASEFEKVESEYIFIRKENLLEWDEAKEKKQKAQMLNLQVDFDINTVKSIKLIRN